MTEFFEAIHGRNDANGAPDADDPSAAQSKGPTKSEMEKLLEKYG